jgi:hypothetical protein
MVQSLARERLSWPTPPGHIHGVSPFQFKLFVRMPDRQVETAERLLLRDRQERAADLPPDISTSVGVISLRTTKQAVKR